MPGKYLAQNYLYRYRYAIGLYYFMYSTYLRTGTVVFVRQYPSVCNLRSWTLRFWEVIGRQRRKRLEVSVPKLPVRGTGTVEV